MDPKARRLLVSQAPLDQIPASAFLPTLSAVLGPGVVLAQRISPDASSPAAAAAARAIAAPRQAPAAGHWRWPAAEGASHSARLTAMAAALEGIPALYFSVRWGTLGALRASPILILPHAVPLAERGLGCLVTSLDGDEGLRLDLVDGDSAYPGSGTFELFVWGEHWRRAAQETVEPAPTR